MACPDILDIEKQECLNNSGGLGLTINVWQSKDRSAMIFNDTTGVYDQVEFDDGGSPATLIVPKSITFHKNTANLVQSGAGEEATANNTNTATLSITINYQDYLKSRAISIMAGGQRELDIAFAHNNGTKWFMPNTVLKSYEANSGTLKADGSNYVLNFTGEYDELIGGLEDADYELLVTTGSTIPA